MKRDVGARMLAAGLVAVCGGVFGAPDDPPTIDGKPLPLLIKQLRSDNRGFQLRAAQSLLKASSNDMARIVPDVISILNSDRENDRFVAAQVLGEYGAASRSAIPHLLPLLQGTQFERNRTAAAKALGQILMDSEPFPEVDNVTQALIAVFDDKYSDVRREAVTACGMIGPAAKACIPHLPARLGDRGEGGGIDMVRRAAAWTCGRMGPLAAEHIDLLVSMMHSSRYPEVVEAIGEIGPVQGNIVPNIKRRMEQIMNVHDMLLGEPKEAEYIPTCFAVLEKFGPKSEPAAPFMMRLLFERPREFGGPHIPLLAVRVLGAIGPAAKDAVPDIEKLIAATKDPKVKEAAEQALVRIKGPR